ncbi:MAG: septum site-determining protein MinC [Alphaproteobacteria bacterium]|nr:septum site-determining protein MinC [Alphaproteobacteria bacterium]
MRRLEEPGARPPKFSDAKGAAINLIQGALFTVMVLRLGDAEIPDSEEKLRAQIGRSPKFFANAPIVLDLSNSRRFADAVEFIELKRLLRSLDLVPVGIQNGGAEQQRAAAAAGLGVFTGPGAQQRRSASDRESAPAKPTSGTKSLLVAQPVRSGTQIYARGGDLIVLKSVSAGAEIIADGHIHVYGTLRGRAIAGATGDGAARIFVNRLEAELVSIAGRYLVSDHIGIEHFGQATQVLLQDDRVTIVRS